MRNAQVFESCLKEKFSTYLDLRENQGHNASKEQHIFSSLDNYLEQTRFIVQNLPPYIIDGWISILLKELGSVTIDD